MEEITIQEEDLTLQWRGNTSRLTKVRLKNIHVMEMWYNKQTTKENVQEIVTLDIIKNRKSLVLEVYPKKSIHTGPNLSRISVPVFFIKAPINRGIFEEIFGETLKS